MIYHVYPWHSSLEAKGIITFKHKFSYKQQEGTKKNPKWQTHEFEGAAIELPETLEALQAFILKHGPVILKPPTRIRNTQNLFWSIYVTDDEGHFGQK